MKCLKMLVNDVHILKSTHKYSLFSILNTILSMLLIVFKYVWNGLFTAVPCRLLPSCHLPSSLLYHEKMLPAIIIQFFKYRYHLFISQFLMMFLFHTNKWETIRGELRYCRYVNRERGRIRIVVAIDKVFIIHK